MTTKELAVPVTGPAELIDESRCLWLARSVLDGVPKYAGDDEALAIEIEHAIQRFLEQEGYVP